MRGEVAHYSSFLIDHSSLAVDSSLALGMTEKSERNDTPAFVMLSVSEGSTTLPCFSVAETSLSL